MHLERSQMFGTCQFAVGYDWDICQPHTFQYPRSFFVRIWRFGWRLYFGKRLGC